MKKFAYVTVTMAILSSVVLFYPVAAQVVTCDEQTGQAVGYVGGDASTLAVLDGMTNDTNQLRLRLRNKGANFQPTNNYPVTSNKRMTGAAGDFNLDGFVDLVQGGRDCDDNANMSDTNLSIHLSKGLDPSDPTRFAFHPPVYIDYLTTILGGTYEITALGTGDYDRDGDPDIAALDWQGILWIFWNRFVENLQDPGSEPIFDPVPTPVLGSRDTSDLINDGYGEYGTGATQWRWESNIESVDFDGDDDLDLVVGVPSGYASSRYGEVVIFVNDGTGVFSLLIKSAKNFINPYSGQYGVDGVAAGDFDGDGRADIVCGSVHSRSIYFYQGDGLGNFTRRSARTITIPVNSGSCTMLRAGDLEGDGDLDLVLATDGHVTNAPGGFVFWYESLNNGSFISHPIPNTGGQISPSGDLDSGALGDFDADDDIDFFVADGNDSLNCYFFMNDAYETYVPQGTTSSNNRVSCDFQNLGYAIVSATMTAQVDLPSGTTVTFYLSNSNDENGQPKWEGPVTSGRVWNFQAPGLFLRWAAEVTSADERTTPGIRSVDFTYTYIGRREYSRTSQATLLADVNASHDGDEEVLYSASFEFPNWRGHLRAWDVSALDLRYTKNSELKDIRDANAHFRFDAGELLTARSWNTRTVYTAYDAQDDDKMNDRLDFRTADKDILDGYLGLGENSPEVEPLIEWALGRDRSWKLGDINHSSPQAVGPPVGTASLMGSGYEAFKSAYAERTKVVFAGANDGMLHCFDAGTLEELWAFIPNNLLWKLKKMRIVDPDCGEYLSHEYFVDGTPAVQDAYFGGAWHTILVCGQAAGWGRNNKCYYFCLDVTNTLDPQPLWEFTDELTMGETWSVPAIGKVQAVDRWIAFFGSGYDNDTANTVGNVLYALDVETGLAVSTLELRENGESSPYGIQNTLPGSPAAADLNNDGFIDFIYIGDLLGRLWRVTATSLPPSEWEATVVYRDPDRNPIITKPAIQEILAENAVKIYFGTGGDERAPNDGYYAFMAVKDYGADAASISWYLGPDSIAEHYSINLTLKKGDLGQGDKVWADPVIADRLIYIATLRNSIENLNPCLNLLGYGKIYARYTVGNQVGGSALLNMATGEVTEYLYTKQKVRSAVTVGATQSVRSDGLPDLTKRKIYIQSYTRPEANEEPPSEVLAQAVKGSGYILVKSWREVLKVYR